MAVYCRIRRDDWLPLEPKEPEYTAESRQGFRIGGAAATPWQECRPFRVGARMPNTDEDLVRRTRRSLAVQDDLLMLRAPAEANCGAGILTRRADGSRREEALLTGKTLVVPHDWSGDGRFLMSIHSTKSEAGSEKRSESVASSAPGERKPTAFLQTEFEETHAQFFPGADPKWIAYTSHESGQPEVYVQTFPAGGGKWQVSTAGGSQPRWRRDGRELYYLAPPDTIMAVEIAARPGFRAAVPKALFRISSRLAVAPSWIYDVTADGRKFVVLSARDDAASSISVWLNWEAALNR